MRFIPAGVPQCSNLSVRRFVKSKDDALPEAGRPGELDGFVFLWGGLADDNRLPASDCRPPTTAYGLYSY